MYLYNFFVHVPVVLHPCAFGKEGHSYIYSWNYRFSCISLYLSLSLYVSISISVSILLQSSSCLCLSYPGASGPVSLCLRQGGRYLYIVTDDRFSYTYISGCIPHLIQHHTWCVLSRCQWSSFPVPSARRAAAPSGSAPSSRATSWRARPRCQARIFRWRDSRNFMTVSWRRYTYISMYVYIYTTPIVMDGQIDICR